MEVGCILSFYLPFIMRNILNYRLHLVTSSWLHVAFALQFLNRLEFEAKFNLKKKIDSQQCTIRLIRRQMQRLGKLPNLSSHFLIYKMEIIITASSGMLLGFYWYLLRGPKKCGTDFRIVWHIRFILLFISEINLVKICIYITEISVKTNDNFRDTCYVFIFEASRRNVASYLD